METFTKIETTNQYPEWNKYFRYWEYHYKGGLIQYKREAKIGYEYLNGQHGDLEKINQLINDYNNRV